MYLHHHAKNNMNNKWQKSKIEIVDEKSTEIKQNYFVFQKLQADWNFLFQFFVISIFSTTFYTICCYLYVYNRQWTDSKYNFFYKIKTVVYCTMHIYFFLQKSEWNCDKNRILFIKPIFFPIFYLFYLFLVFFFLSLSLNFILFSFVFFIAWFNSVLTFFR